MRAYEYSLTTNMTSRKKPQQFVVYIQEDKSEELKEGTGSMLLFSFICIVLLKIHYALYNRLHYLFSQFQRFGEKQNLWF